MQASILYQSEHHMETNKADQTIERLADGKACGHYSKANKHRETNTADQTEINQ